MKKTDLEKLKGLRLKPRGGVPGAGGQFGKEDPAAPRRREQREIDRAAGLVPFAVKLDSGLVKKLHSLAQERKTGLNEIVGELLETGLKSK